MYMFSTCLHVYWSGDDLEVAPPTKLSDVEQAQKDILTVARKLADSGEIMLGGGGGDELV